MTAIPAPELTAKFRGTRGWVGGDGAYSCPLGSARILWLFGDTPVGAVENGRRRMDAFIHNSI
jgi:hypothetical protein